MDNGKTTSRNSAAPVRTSSLGMRAGAARSGPSASVFRQSGFRESQVVRASFRFPPAELCVSFRHDSSLGAWNSEPFFQQRWQIPCIRQIDPACRNCKNSSLRNGFESSSIAPDLFRKVPDGYLDRPFQSLYSSAAFFAASLDVFTAFVRKQETKSRSNVPRCSKNFAFIPTGLKAPTNRYAIKWCVLGTFWNGWNVKEAQRYS